MVFEAHRYRVAILDDAVAEIRRIAGVWAPLEGGGVLVGSSYPLGDELVHVIERVIPPPPDSICRSGEFERGEQGLAEALEALSPMIYLGEWHTHGSGDISPSHIDELAMFQIAADAGYCQPSPILAIAKAQGEQIEPFDLTITIFSGADRIDLRQVV